MHCTKYTYIIIFIVFSILTSCKKETPDNQKSPDFLKQGILVLNEGLFQLNNASLSWVDRASGNSNNEFFTQKTNRLLGDTGNDMKLYGGKIYIVVNVSSTIEVLNAYTGEAIQQISMLNGANPKQPRNIVFSGNKAFVSCFDGFVDVIDTTTLTITQRIPVGLNPESMAIVGQRLFVSNSGGLNTPVMDSTVSVIDLNALSEVSKVVVGKNPGGISIDDHGNIFVISRGNYGSIPSRLKRIDGATLSVTSYPFAASGVYKMENKMLISFTNPSNQTTQIGLFNPQTELMEQTDFLDISSVETFAGMQYEPAAELLFVMDANNYTTTGYIFEYSKTGNFKQKYHVGLIPNSIIYYE